MKPMYRENKLIVHALIDFLNSDANFEGVTYLKTKDGAKNICEIKIYKDASPELKYQQLDGRYTEEIKRAMTTLKINVPSIKIKEKKGAIL